MACLFPLKGWKSSTGGFTRVRADSPHGLPMTIPCGRCRECRMAIARDWGIRAMHDVKAHTRTGSGSAFVTLTLDDTKVHDCVGLDPRMLKLFHMRANARLGGGLRYLSVGEYGDKNQRPHYHCIFTNKGFADRKWCANGSTGEKLYESKILNELWPHGYAHIGDVSYKSAMYVARYVLKKVSPELYGERYERIVAGKQIFVPPEFAVMSRRPGLGRPFYDLYKEELLANDSCIVDGHKSPLPRYYSNVFKAEDPDAYERLRKQRKRESVEYRADHPEEQQWLRRTQLEEFNRLKGNRLKRVV